MVDSRYYSKFISRSCSFLFPRLYNQCCNLCEMLPAKMSPNYALLVQFLVTVLWIWLLVALAFLIYNFYQKLSDVSSTRCCVIPVLKLSACPHKVIGSLIETFCLIRLSRHVGLVENVACDVCHPDACFPRHQDFSVLQSGYQWLLPEQNKEHRLCRREMVQ